MRFLKRRNARKVPICLFCYHKVGTVLFAKVFRAISEQQKWNYRYTFEKQDQIPKGADVVLFSPAQIDVGAVKRPFVGIHVIRDPRDVIVSGYLYHRRTSEEWCTNSDLTPTTPILFPKVPYSQQHRPEDWKVQYLESLNGMSYQDNLLSMSQYDGLLFEMENYGAWTTQAMRDWDYTRENILEIKFEDLMSNFDNTFRRIFEHLGLSPDLVESSMEIAAEHDLGRMSSKQVSQIEHVSSKHTTKWEKYFEEEHKAMFKRKFGDVLVELGYEENNDW